MADFCDIYFARGLDMRQARHYIRCKIVERDEEMVHLLGILLLGTVKVAAGAAILWLLLQLLGL